MLAKSTCGVTLRQLQIFREVLRTGSERLAAKNLKITQPAVSQQIRQLEGEVGRSRGVRGRGLRASPLLGHALSSWERQQAEQPLRRWCG